MTISLGFLFLLMVCVAGLVVFPCLVMAAKADRQVQRCWDDRTDASADRMLNERIRRGKVSRCQHPGKNQMRKRHAPAKR